MPAGRYVYCFVPPGHAPPAGLTGVSDAPVVAMDVAAVAAWLSPLERRPDAALDAVRAHNRVVERAMTETVTPVPLRFGQWFPTEAAAVLAAERDSTQWCELLARFAGAAEYGLRILSPDGAARLLHRERTGGGAAYLRSRARDRVGALDEAGRAAADLVRERLGRHTRAEKARPSTNVSGGIEVAHLVAHEQREPYLAGVEALRAEHSQLRFLSSGPWPPYSFVP